MCAHWEGEESTGFGVNYSKVMRVERRGEGYLIAVPREAMEELHLADGAEVQVLPIRSKQSGTEHRHATVEEGLDAFRRTEGLHKNTYRELAKLPWSF